MDAYLGEIRAFGFNFCPNGWRYCDGSFLDKGLYQALFAVIGNTFGETSTSFALPNLQSRVVVGQSPALVFGGVTGAESATLTNAHQVPVHSHTLQGSTGPLSVDLTAAPDANGTSWIAQRAQYHDPATGTYFGVGEYTLTGPPNAMAAAGQLTPFGSAAPQPHENRQPVLAITFCICIENGEFPMRWD